MKRQDAEKLLNTQVQAWTAANGIYVGKLVEVLPTKPWRGKVEITGILQFATPYEIGRSHQRKGFKPGQIIEVGGTNIKPTTEQGVGYLQILQNTLSVYEDYKKRLETGAIAERDRWWIERSLKELQKRIAEENEKTNPLDPPMTVTAFTNQTNPSIME